MTLTWLVHDERGREGVAEKESEGERRGWSGREGEGRREEERDQLDLNAFIRSAHTNCVMSNMTYLH